MVDLSKHLVKPVLYFLSIPNGWPCRSLEDCCSMAAAVRGQDIHLIWICILCKKKFQTSNKTNKTKEYGNPVYSKDNGFAVYLEYTTLGLAFFGLPSPSPSLFSAWFYLRLKDKMKISWPFIIKFLSQDYELVFE